MMRFNVAKFLSHLDRKKDWTREELKELILKLIVEQEQ